MPEDTKSNQSNDESTAHHSPSSDTPTAASPARVVETISTSKLGPGGLVLQWLTYAFWGWAALSLSWLVFLVLNTALNRSDSSYFSFDGLVPYALAGTIVLLIIALVTDIFFKRIEPKEKQGASTVIMIIHAVIFALFAIGWLIVGVFGLVVLLIGTGSESNNGVLTQLSTSAVMVIVYGATLLRTLNPSKIPRVPLLYWIFMGVVMLVTIVLAIVGPVAAQREALKDEPVERGVQSLSSAINRYANAEGELPSLQQVAPDASLDAREMIDEGRITYTPKEEITDDAAPERMAMPGAVQRKTWHYEICGEYQTEKQTGYDDYSGDYYDDENRYDTRPNTQEHDAGKVCYQLQTRIR